MPWTGAPALLAKVTWVVMEPWLHASVDPSMKDAYRIDGARNPQPIVLLHSSGLSSQQWRKLVSNLSEYQTVITPDFLGCGDNPAWPPERDFDLRMDIDPVRALLRTLERPAHVVGHSYGAFIGLAVARLEPSRVPSLALYEPTAFRVLNPVDDEEAVISLMELSTRLFHDEARPHPGTEEWFRIFCEYWAAQDIWEMMPQATRVSFLHAGRKVELEASAMMLDPTTVDEYRKVVAPTLLMCGGRSPASTRRIASRLAAVLPHARLHEFASAGHLGPMTNSNAINKTIEEHLARVTGLTVTSPSPAA